MLLLEGYLKQLWIDRDSAARGGPPWAIRVTNGRGRSVTFKARAWRLRPSPGQLRGAGGTGEGPLLPDGPYYWLETAMAIDADIPDMLSAQLTLTKLRLPQPEAAVSDPIVLRLPATGADIDKFIRDRHLGASLKGGR